jgi:hypothetical protein
MKITDRATIIFLLLVFFLCNLQIAAQQRKISKDAFQITDAATGQTITEVLIIPRYSSANGIFIAPEGPAKGTYRYYLDKPFLYRSGESFILKTPKFSGLPLFPVLIGKGRTIEGILIVASGYHPVWFENLWDIDLWGKGDARKIPMTPMPEKEWSDLTKKNLLPLTKENILPVEDFRFWGFAGSESALYVYYNKKERELVRTFLQR